VSPRRPTMTRRTLALATGAVLLVLAGLVPAVVENPFVLLLLDMALINGVMALGLNVILKTGQVSLAHAGFMAIGAYLSAHLTLQLGVPFLVGFAAAGLGAALSRASTSSSSPSR
jgi:branched-chain amino acid transport system permease protein